MRILSKDVPNRVGESITLMGWVHARRDHGKLIFIDLRDRWGIVQVVFSPDNKTILQEADKLRSEWVIQVEGVIQKRPAGMENPELPTGSIELHAEKLEVLSAAEDLPIPLGEEGTDEAALQKRLDWRWIDLRNPKRALIFHVWTAMEQAFREYWTSHDYIEIHSPKFMNAPSESGAELFEVKYFDRKAYLAQSPQFYKQMAMAAGFEKVFEVGPVFRANPSFTSRHDTEFTGYDIEISFIDSHYDVMAEEEKILSYVLEKLKTSFGEEIFRHYERKLTVPLIPFPKVTMQEAKKILAGLGVANEREGDLSPEEERALSEFILKKEGHEFVFVTDYPITVRPFYHMRHPDNKNLTKSFDLLWNGLEVTTGAQREHHYDMLVNQAKEKGLNLEPIKHYLDFFKYGCPPHGGFGHGPSRMLMKIFNINNVREVTYLYRGVNRLEP
ncbi:MAG: aspartate--tRNA(Asn) ligase [Candidatus Sungiibacteriota bacterium]|uniref:Aspartate--tRNA ligase n=1 Tax=Candidatus Sungiibacteriota bacterium TaxID=2750080 RepID=A0A7T5US52_9BACT|nr:MAG: aspartate--tRNA(Asn) ligase [Candidatus Sungbacteria bacterium]